MPKQIWKIERFDGGLSTSADPRDIETNELVSATNLMIDKVGRVRVMGQFNNHTAGNPEDDQATGWNQSNPNKPGYGLI